MHQNKFILLLIMSHLVVLLYCVLESKSSFYLGGETLMSNLVG